MTSEKQAVVVNPCAECWPCAVCRQFVEVGGACKSGRTTTQCSKEIASRNGRLPMFMIKDPFIEEGRAAFEEQEDNQAEKADCPYESGTDGAEGWNLGWRQARLDARAKANDKDDIAHDTAAMHRCLLTGQYTDTTDQVL